MPADKSSKKRVRPHPSEKPEPSIKEAEAILQAANQKRMEKGKAEIEKVLRKYNINLAPAFQIVGQQLNNVTLGYQLTVVDFNWKQFDQQQAAAKGGAKPPAGK
jgi:hypothetical protein